MVIKLNMTTTPRLRPEALKNLDSNKLMAVELNIQTRFMGGIKVDKVAALLKLDVNDNLPAGVMVMAQK